MNGAKKIECDKEAEKVSRNHLRQNDRREVAERVEVLVGESDGRHDRESNGDMTKIKEPKAKDTEKTMENRLRGAILQLTDRRIVRILTIGCLSHGVQQRLNKHQMCTVRGDT